MRDGHCLFATASIDFVEGLKRRVESDVISIIHIPRFYGFDNARNVHRLHTAIIFTPDGLDARPEEAAIHIREHDPKMVTIAILDGRNDNLEQELLLLGCDDVVTAPFCMDTLASRLLLRIRQRGWSVGSDQVVNLCGTTIDFRELKVHRNGDERSISRGLADLLQHFLDNANEVVARDEICQSLWENHVIDPQGKNLDMQVSKLRKLLDPNGRRHVIETVRGRGYRLRVNPGELSFYVDRGSAGRFLTSQSAANHSMHVRRGGASGS